MTAPGAAPGIDTLDDRLAATTAAVAESRRRVERGHSGDAGTLAELVGKVLREADPRSTVRPAATRALLVALLDEVQTFMEAIERERATAGMHLRDLAARGRAGQAYGAGR
jgi:hypothetical protein